MPAKTHKNPEERICWVHSTWHSMARLLSLSYVSVLKTEATTKQKRCFVDFCTRGSRSGRSGSCHCSSQMLDGANDIASPCMFNLLPQTSRCLLMLGKPVTRKENGHRTISQISEVADPLHWLTAHQSRISYGFDPSCVMEILAQMQKNPK